jgi:methanogenic corrinoid protein MtbC1
VACAPGELHELGARIAANFLEMGGFALRFVGAYVPAEAITRMVRDTRPDLVVMSAATSLCFPGLREALQAVHDAAPEVPILVGGSAFSWSDACDVPAGVVHAGHNARDLVVAVQRELLAA